MSKKILFIDRDGTLIVEPPDDFQVDSLEKLRFIPGVFTWLGKISSELDYILVMVTNQDGLGTSSFPEDSFWTPHNKMMEALAGEGIHFSDVLIDPSFPEDNSPNRKPRLGLVQKYLNEDYDIQNSWVIGDRGSDMEFALNMGSKGILVTFHNGESPSDNEEKNQIFQASSWKEIYNHLKLSKRTAHVVRNTNETNIEIILDLDGMGSSNCNTGLGFFNHMLDQLAKHSKCDLTINVKGDLDVDEHHTIEDTAIALGEAFLEALGDKVGMNRYGFLLPMDDALAQVAIDFGGRSWLVWDAEFKREKIGDMPTEMFYHFFKSFCEAAKCNLNIKVEGQNEHHKIEGIFKAWAKSIRMAVTRNPDDSSLPTTKGVL